MGRYEEVHVGYFGTVIYNDTGLIGEGIEPDAGPGRVSVGMDCDGDGILITADSADQMIEWAEALLGRLRAGEGASGFGEQTRTFVFADADRLVLDAEGLARPSRHRRTDSVRRSIDGRSTMEDVQTKVDVVTAGQAHDARVSGVSLHCPDATSWAGSYGVLVAALFRDVLGDGGPVDATVYTEGDDLTGRQARRYRGTVTEVSPDGAELVFADGHRIRVEDTVSVFL